MESGDAVSALMPGEKGLKKIFCDGVLGRRHEVEPDPQPTEVRDTVESPIIT